MINQVEGKFSSASRSASHSIIKVLVPSLNRKLWRIVGAFHCGFRSKDGPGQL